jgi:hypothetical protein
MNGATKTTTGNMVKKDIPQARKGLDEGSNQS